MTGRMLRHAAILGTSAIALAGCGFHGIYSLPLPGAAGNGKPNNIITVQFRDALDLVPYSTVKVNNATVGHVKSVSLVHGLATVVCTVPKSVHLPANTVASIAQTSLLGEKFVELEPPAQGATGQLVNGAVIPVARTDTSATVEEVLGALSLLLNGGGLNQIHTITTELNNALAGHEGTARDVLTQINTLTSGLNAQKGDIIRAMEGIDHLTATVKSQESTLVNAIDTMPQALKILADNRSQLTTMLVSLQHLGDVAVRVEKASQADLVGNLHDLQPTLNKLAEAGTNISKSLEVLFTFPVASGSYRGVYKGDYTNIGVVLDLRTQKLLHNYGLDSGSSGGGSSGSGGKLPIPGLPSLPSLPSLPGNGSSSSPSSPKSSSPSLPLPKLPLGPASASQSAAVTEFVTPDKGTYGSDIAKLLLEVVR
jgi:phospholipid/cholesterol/gamma-HCH transport system substrate-binding protein